MTVVDYLEQSAKKYQDEYYITDINKSFTYREVVKYSKAIANVLIKKKIKKQPIAIMMNKTADMLLVFYGVIYSGNYYVPIDVSLPEHRLNLILEKLSPAFIISDRVNIEKAIKLNATCDIKIYEEIDLKDINENALQKIRTETIETDPMYVLFTSGTTGIPKGVVLPHRAVIDFVEEMTKTFDIRNNDVFGNKSAFHFDFSVLELYCAAKTGSHIIIIPDELFTFPIKLLSFMKEKKITIISWVPSALVLVANLRALGKVNLPDLRQVFFCGEIMPTKQLNMWRNQYRKVKYVNLYGPTETAVASTYHIVEREYKDSDNLPIGIPFQNTDVILLNDRDQLANSGEIGEICIRGPSLANGYYKEPELTKEKFVQNPINKEYLDPIYKTGDLAKTNKLGELLYCGRKDNQIKHHGFRIELEEIEAVANQHKNVILSCSVYDTKRHEIVLFYASEQEIHDFNKYLKDKLPKFMQPKMIYFIKKMPLTQNGKIDRKKVLSIYEEKRSN